jgi:hypothetical protein
MTAKKVTPAKATAKPAPKAPSKVLKAPAKTVKETVTKQDPVISEIKDLLTSGVRVANETPPEPVAVASSMPVPPLEEAPADQQTSVETNQKDVFLISKALCMSCVHLCPETGTQSPTSCHYDAGNEDCPARTTVIQLGMSRKEIEKAATAIVEATFNGDFERLNLASQRLSRKSESVRASVSARVLELQAQRTAK